MITVKSTIPHYASNRYHNTLELLRNASNMLDNNAEGRLGGLKKHERVKIQKFHRSLSIKANVLGYLEALTLGGVHKKQLNNDDMRLYTDWILSDTPKNPFPLNQHSDAIPHIKWLREHIDSAQNKSSAKRDVLRSLYLESKPEVALDQVENIVFAGGGAKALSLAGAVKSLEMRGADTQIQRVAGTSGGAILALAFASGYSAKEIENIVLDNNFGLFTLGSVADNGVLNQWAYSAYGDKPKSILHVLSDNKLARHYYSSLMNAMGSALQHTDNPRLVNIKRALNSDPLLTQSQDPSAVGEKFVDILKKMPNKDVFFYALLDQLPVKMQIEIDNDARKQTVELMGDEAFIGAAILHKSPREAMLNAMRYGSKQDIVLGFFSDIVFNKLITLPKPDLREALYGEAFRDNTLRPIKHSDVRSISFSQWQRLHTLLPGKIKELHISISILKPFLKRRTGWSYDPYMHEDAAFDNPEFSDMRVVDAVRVSMNLPPVYAHYQFSVNGNAYKGSDGGLKSNMSLSTFDSKFPPEKTIGVFYKTGAELESAQNVERMLVLPRSKSDIENDLLIAQCLDKEAHDDVNRLKVIIHNIERYGDAGSELDMHHAALNTAVDARRRLGFAIQKHQQEFDVIGEAHKGPFETLFTEPLTGVKHLLAAYLGSKSDDNLSEVHNLRRLVMVNTADVDTWHFKMSDEDKNSQMEFGQKAMDSLLNGTYCLENHFYYHKFKGVGGALLQPRLETVFGHGLFYKVDTHHAPAPLLSPSPLVTSSITRARKDP
jgi:predicted acylesterase/phospholipase RssA